MGTALGIAGYTFVAVGGYFIIDGVIKIVSSL